MRDKLTEKQKQFCHEYVIDFNGAQAAIRAGYSEDTAKEIASENLTKPNVNAYVKALTAKKRDKNELLADRVIAELVKVGFANIQDYIDTGNSVTDLTLISKGKAAAVASVKKSVTTFEGGEKETVEFKLHDKISALEKIGRHLGLFEADNKREVLLKMGKDLADEFTD